MDHKTFIAELEKLNAFLDDTQLKQLEEYYQLLITWNEKMNLTGIVEKKDVYLKHYYDSITLCKSIDTTQSLTLCDIGTGAGFPGLVLKIVFPNLKVTLIDSHQKRITFLEEVIQTLHIIDIEVIKARAEEYAQQVREKYDIVTSRAVAPLTILMEYSVPLVKKGGYFIPMKSHVEEEMNHIENALQKLSVTLVNINTFTLPIEESKRSLITFQKKATTDSIYPRRYGDIKKKPL